MYIFRKIGLTILSKSFIVGYNKTKAKPTRAGRENKMKNTAELNQMAKAQTFGVEIEMTGITRNKAAKTAAEFFGTGRYEDTAYRNGYSAWSAFDAEGREWKFVSDASIRATSSGTSTEMVTPVLGYEDMETLQELCRRLRKAGAKSNADLGCGVHIHIGLKAKDGTEHTPKTIKNLANLMASHEDLIAAVVGIDAARTTRWCRVARESFLKGINGKGNRLTWETIDKAFYEDGALGSRNQRYANARYQMLNLHPTLQSKLGTADSGHTKPTVEFRCFEFDRPANGRQNGIHAGQLKAYIDFCLALSALAKASRGISYKKGQRENKKYAMRTWLLRLGFIGDEYKNDRQHLMRNLEGNGAWR